MRGRPQEAPILCAVSYAICEDHEGSTDSAVDFLDSFTFESVPTATGRAIHYPSNPSSLRINLRDLSNVVTAVGSFSTCPRH